MHTHKVCFGTKNKLLSAYILHLNARLLSDIVIWQQIVTFFGTAENKHFLILSSQSHSKETLSCKKIVLLENKHSPMFYSCS